MSRPADQDGVPPQKDVENGVPPQDDVPKPQDDVPPPTTTELARVIDVVPQEGDLEAALKVGHGGLLAAGTGILAFNKGKQKKGSANGKRKSSEGGEPAAARPAAKRVSLDDAAKPRVHLLKLFLVKANPFISVEYPEARRRHAPRQGRHDPGSPRARQAAGGGRLHVTYLDLKKPVVKFTQDTPPSGGPKAGAL
ncbi:hypothetical protein JL720_6508 [Aureococcus anophagefferens]|nr:hypothetical protein JL720_6508 [Aureococcus anophagefferens]